MHNEPKNKIYKLYRFIQLTDTGEIQKKLQNKLNSKKLHKDRDIKGVMKYPGKECTYEKQGQ